jgi:hypothetical protein
MVDKKLCFVIGPIGDEGSDARVHADWLLEGIIEPVMTDFPGFTVKRADHDPRPGLIDAQMINDLLNADLVIADLSFLNPNAFYEIGIRHMAQKPIIHMQLREETPPFDLSLYRAVKFSRNKFSDLSLARAELSKAVTAVLEDGYQVENPVTNARGRFQLQQHATPSQQVLFDQLRAIEQRLAKIERYEDPEVTVSAQPIRPRTEPHDPPLQVGETVFHSKFGRGPIIGIDGSRVTIEFSVGTKRVVDSFITRLPHSK